MHVDLETKLEKCLEKFQFNEFHNEIKFQNDRKLSKLSEFTQKLSIRDQFRTLNCYASPQS